MMVSVARSASDAIAHPLVDLVVGDPAGSAGLVQQVHLGGGLDTTIDLLRPDRWRAVSAVELNDTSKALLRAVVGAGAAEELDAPGSWSEPAPGRRWAVDAVHAAPWLRVAVVDAVDRWLQVPLEQSLVDAERGVSRWWAASTLPEGPARELLVGEALRMARRSSRGLVGLLEGLVLRDQLVPTGLFAALRRLVEGYAELLREVDGPDRRLRAVLVGWRRLSGRLGQAHALDIDGLRSTFARPAGLACPEPLPTAMVDPRQLRARLVRLSADPASSEVTVSAPRSGDPDAVIVRAEAFGPVLDVDARSRLMVRLVDRRTAAPRGHAPLVMVPGAPDVGGAPVFEAAIPLGGANPDDVRIDIYDGLSALPPVGADDALRDVRRASVFLGEWRRLVSLARLPVVAFDPASRLRDLATRLRADDDAGDPLFPGGPSYAELEALAAVGDAELEGRLRDGRGAGGLSVVAHGNAAPLVAELAAAYQAEGQEVAPSRA
jgi:hypothetical protein